ncbi:MAG: hypothetical protein JXR23_07400 [Pontiellaceae bacterium]|nr:hypothetical protein [Pontiellaceae bacterium]
MAHLCLRGEEESNLVVAHPAGKTAYRVVDNVCKVRRRSQSDMISFRMSVMATIGILGSAADLEFLGKYTDSSDMRLRTAARAAAERIEA